LDDILQFAFAPTSPQVQLKQPSPAMKIAHTVAFLAASVAQLAAAQQVGTLTPEVHPAMPSQTCTTSGGCTAEQTKIVLDANRRQLHDVNSDKSCFTGNQWDATLCPDPATCTKNCALEGANYPGTYGVNAKDGEVALTLVTQSQNNTNYGARIYLMEDDDHYKTFKLLNQEFTFDVDASQLPCGVIGALYFVQMDADGGKSKYPGNAAGAAYGTGYCDAQCPHSLKFVNGEANVENWVPSKSDPKAGSGKYGTCCPEMDIWEANQISNSLSPHPCTVNGQTRCLTAAECSVCDKDGCSWNPYRMGNKTFYGPGSQFTIDSTKPLTVVTRFITSDGTANGDLVEIKRLYKQDGKTYEMPNANWKGIDPVNTTTDKMCNQQKATFNITNDFAVKGGVRSMGEALRAGVVLTMSIWVDFGTQGLWLDSSFPVGKDPSLPGVVRGSCPTTSGKPADVMAQTPGATIKYSNIRVGDIGSTTQ
jgi:cellulose 1,4-beta-cellobiosidase